MRIGPFIKEPEPTNTYFSWGPRWWWKPSEFALALSFFADTEVGHNRRMSNTIVRHPVTLRVGTHLIFSLSTQAPGFIHFLQSRLSKPSWFRAYMSACEGGSVGLARGTIAGVCVEGGGWGGSCGLFVLSFRKRAYGFSRRNAGS